MFISKHIQQFMQRRAENKRIAIDTRTYKEQEIANLHSGFSLSQIVDIISHAEEELARLPFFLRRNQRIHIAGLYRAHKLISARSKAAARYEEVPTLANAPTVFIQKKKAA